MNNWKAVGYIFLGFGSVFLGIALIAILAIIAMNPTPFDLSPVALVADAPWLILAALTYVFGFVGYFAGKENDFKKRKKLLYEELSEYHRYGLFQLEQLLSP